MLVKTLGRKEQGRAFDIKGIRERMINVYRRELTLSDNIVIVELDKPLLSFVGTKLTAYVMMRLSHIIKAIMDWWKAKWWLYIADEYKECLNDIRDNVMLVFLTIPNYISKDDEIYLKSYFERLKDKDTDRHISEENSKYITKDKSCQTDEDREFLANWDKMDREIRDYHQIFHIELNTLISFLNENGKDSVNEKLVECLNIVSINIDKYSKMVESTIKNTERWYEITSKRII